MLLAIDTATRTAGLALYDEEGVQAELTWRSRQNHTVELMNQIVHLLNLARAGKHELTVIGVSLGPGSFTGLRVGMSVAKGLAFGCDIPLVAIPTLDSVAKAHAFQTLPILAVLAAGRGRYSVAPYHALRGKVERVAEYALVDASGMVELAKQATASSQSGTQARARRLFFCGEIDAPLKEALVKGLGPRACIASPAANLRRAGFLAELAWERYRREEFDNPETLAPTYMPYASVEGATAGPRL